MRRIACSICAAVVFTLAATSAFAQSNERVYEEYDFRFVTPGARAVGMGKTFTGLADDATAAFSNPAGLSNILEAEFSIEIVGTQILNHRTVTATSGANSISAFGDFVPAITFASVVVPVHDFTISGFYQKMQKYRERFTFGEIEPSRDGPERTAGDLDLNADNFGLGLSYVMSRTVSIGGTFVVTRFNGTVESHFGTAVLAGLAKGEAGANTSGASTSISGILGVQWKPWRRFWLGAAYYIGSGHTVGHELFGNFARKAFSRPNDGTNHALALEDPTGYTCATPLTKQTRPNPKAGDPPLLNPFVDLTGCTGEIEFRFPDRFSTGFAYKATNTITIVGEVGWTNYSSLVGENFRIVNYNDPAQQLTPSDYFVEDTVDLHIGAEYRIYGTRRTWAFRGGFFTVPSHTMRFRGTNEPVEIFNATEEERERFNTLNDRGTEPGVAVGFGVALVQGIQFDAAGSFSRESRDLVFSTVFRICELFGAMCVS